MTSTQDTLSAAIDREAAGLVRLYDFSEEAKVSLLSESENRVYLVRDPARPGTRSSGSTPGASLLLTDRHP